MRGKLMGMPEEGGLWEICSDLPPTFPLYFYPEASVFLFCIDMINKKKEELIFEELRAIGLFKIYREIYDYYLHTDSKEIYSLRAFSYLTKALVQ